MGNQIEKARTDSLAGVVHQRGSGRQTVEELVALKVGPIPVLMTGPSYCLFVAITVARFATVKSVDESIFYQKNHIKLIVARSNRSI